MSNELYDSDNPDCPLNAYHIESKPRLLNLEDFDNEGNAVQLIIACTEIGDFEEMKKIKQAKKDENEVVDHRSYQGFQKQKSQVITLHNMISQDFVRGVQKSLTCPICQEMVTNPVQYKQCIHRFCSNCIETYNRQGKKECPLCRVVIQNRRQLRADKNIASLLQHLSEEFRKIQRQEELENNEIKRKLLLEQKKLKERRERQKAKNPSSSTEKQPEETKDERLARLAKEKAANP